MTIAIERYNASPDSPEYLLKQLERTLWRRSRSVSMLEVGQAENSKGINVKRSVPYRS
ncbi:hypothetical protein PQX77_020520, partial [Marasmius sp. AFHP31]